MKATPMQAYQGLIEQFLYEAVPTPNVLAKTKFEAVSTAIIGSKQRRFGPIPAPEIQVAIRQVILDTPDTEPIKFFVPWGASKFYKDAPFDILDFWALKQLQCLQIELARFGRQAQFSFRLEDNMDTWLFGPREKQIYDYVKTFIVVSGIILDRSCTVLESNAVSWNSFKEIATDFQPIFYQYLKGDKPLRDLQDIGWLGEIPLEQRKYYKDVYHLHYPYEDYDFHMSRYFAGTLARKMLKAEVRPSGGNFLSIAFNHPVPGSPTVGNRLYYRTLQERFTNRHQAPWNGQGIIQIGDDNACCPRFLEPHHKPIPTTTPWNGIEIHTPIVLE